MPRNHILALALLLSMVLFAPLFGISKAFAAEEIAPTAPAAVSVYKPVPPIKIIDLKFDNSDNLVLINSQGQINLPPDKTEETSNEETDGIQIHNYITKGFLKDPARAYVDITNAILAGSSKNYELKNSVLKSVKISQFSLNPNIVRIVFNYKAGDIITSNFNVLANNKTVAIRYANSLNVPINNADKNQIIYSNTEDSKRTVFFENTTSVLSDNNAIGQENTLDNSTQLNQMFEKNNEQIVPEKEYKLQSKFYLSSVSKMQNGIMVKGAGFLSLKPVFFLENPNRMVIDLDDTVLSRSLRNRTITFGENSGETLKLGQNSANVARLVIQGADAKNYRVVISPDLQNIFIAKRQDVINAKITETQSIIKTVRGFKDNSKGIETNTLEFTFSNPAAFSVFEENRNLYLDFNNVNSFAAGANEELIKLYPEAKTIKIALDKLRIVLPVSDNTLNIQTKASADAKTIQTVIKTKEPSKEKEQVISKGKEQTISNLYKVVIDAGHGGSDVGATRDGIYEKNITLAIAKMVEKNLKNKDVQTTMTLEKDKTVSLQERCDISNDTRPDVFVSIHVNSSVNDAIYGVETHWWKADSKDYANTVHANLAKNFNKWKTKDRGLFKSQFYVINHTEAPAILVEIGFISNENERKAIITQKRQLEIAKAISEGIMNYLKNKGQKK